jgi:hypothetical protein
VGDRAERRLVKPLIPQAAVEALDKAGEASGSLAMVSWYLIERACFSSISALSRSPTMRWGSRWRLTAVAMISSKAAFMP